MSVDVAPGHANERARTVMTDDDNDHNANDVDFLDTLEKSLALHSWPRREVSR